MTWRLGPVDQRTGGGRPPSARALATPDLRGRPLFVALALFVGMLMVAAAPASAKLVWQQVGSIDGTATPSGSFDGPGRMAVDQSADVLYVLDQGHDALLKYDISGASPVLENFSALGSPEIDGVGAADLTPQGALDLTVNADIAVDNSGGATDGFIYVVTGITGFSGGRVDVFDPTGAYRYQFASNATSVAVDSAGAVYTTPLFGTMAKYTTTTTAATTDPGFVLTQGQGANSVAIDGAGRFYVSTSPALFGAPGVSRFTPTGAADGPVTSVDVKEVAVAPNDDHVFVDRGNAVVEYEAGGASKIGEFGVTELEDSTGLTAAATGDVFASDSQGDQIHHYRTAVLPEVVTGEATEITATTATLHGTVDPAGVPLTVCEFQWGPSGQEGYTRGPVPCSPSPGPNAGVKAVSADLSGLTSGTYHFRLYAENGNGDVGGKDGTFMVGDCVNSDKRTGASVHLPDCRAYELVTPADKDAYTLTQAVSAGGLSYPSANGNQAFFGGIVTPFGDAHNGNFGFYVAMRGRVGWGTHSVAPAACKADQSGQLSGTSLEGFSDDLSVAILLDPADSNCAPEDHAGQDLYRIGPNRDYRWVSQNGMPKTVDVPARLRGLSADATHVVFSTSEKLVLPLENGRTVGGGLYDRTNGSTIPVGLQSDGSLINPCGAVIAGDTSDKDVIGRVSADGRVIFFNSGSSWTVAGCSPFTDDGGQLYARIDASRTVLLSASTLAVPGPRQAPRFLGATRDGRKAFFVSAERLTPDATPGGGLYEYDLSDVLSGSATTGDLTFLTKALTADPAGVSGRSLVGMSDNGSRVYFIATGVLDAGAPTGVLKLYKAEAGQVSYIAPWTGSSSSPATDASISPDGSKVVFLAKPAGSSTTQAWLSDGSASPVCVSCTSGNTPSMGDNKLFGPTGQGRPASMGPQRYVTNDGRVFFNSLDQLADRDTNNKYDVYEYDHGQRHLLSTGTSRQDALLIGTSGRGRDVFFVTNDSLVAQDFDEGDQDIYDARVDGGYSPPPSTPAPCVEACQPPVAAPVLRTPGSAIFAAPFAATPRTSVPKRKVRKVSVKKPKTVRGTKVRLSVKTPEPGRIRVSGSGLRRAKRTAKRSTTYHVTVKLSKRSKRILKRKHRVKVRATVRFTPKHGKRSRVRAHVTFKQKKHHRRARGRSHDRAGGSDRKGGR